MIEVEPLKPRIYINSFPKSGTHLAKLIVAPLARMQEPQHWVGTFSGNSWTTHWIDLEKMVIPVIEGQPEGTWMIGHSGYKPILEEAFQKMKTCMIFVYRDLRDVAVSLTYHIENPNDKIARHPGKPIFMGLKDHKARLKAVIEGIHIYAGIIDRWKFFAPWLDVDWVLPMRFEDMRFRPKEMAYKTINYVIRRTSEGEFFPLVMDEDYANAVAKSIELMGTTEHSGSFRKGAVGEWKKEFDQELLDSFDKVGGNEWLEKLGYEVI